MTKINEILTDRDAETVIESYCQDVPPAGAASRLAQSSAECWLVRDDAIGNRVALVGVDDGPGWIWVARQDDVDAAIYGGES